MRHLFYSLFWLAYRFLPGFRHLALGQARISKWRESGFVGKVLRKGFFAGVYPRLPVTQRQAAQQVLMGGEESSYWSQHHQNLKDVPVAAAAGSSTFPPARGESRVGRLDFLEAFPLFNDLDGFLSGRKAMHVIQIGTCSGKDIAWFSTRHPQLRFTGTDLYDSAVQLARRAHQSGNLGFLQAAADNIHLVASSVTEPEVVIFTNGAALYIFPEILPQVLGRLAQTGKKIHLMVCEPNSRAMMTRPVRRPLSKPSANMGYDHDYRAYAEQAGFSTVTEMNIEPYASGRFPAYMQDRVINFAHFVIDSRATSD